ncbi:MAG: hypothetical protein AAFQ37_08745, partial [Bacteroidota bacterium]
GTEQDIVETNDQGFFSFGDLPLNDDYTVVPFLDRDHMNGVTTQDILIISRHILGLNSFDTPAQYIAADANRSEEITVVDIIAIRRLILGLDDSFQSNTSWRFVHADYQFPDWTNPWAENFPEVANFNNLSGNGLANFVAVKVGDLSGNADPNHGGSNLQDNIEVRSGSATLATEVGQLSASSVTEIPVYASTANLIGLQASINLAEGVQLVDIIDGQATAANNFGLRMVNEGLLTFSYDVTPGTISTDEPLFTLVVSSNSDVATAEAIRVNDRYTRAEAYTNAGDLLNLSLSVNGRNTEVSSAVLYQNIPNPVAEFTTIGFDLTTAAEAQISVQDATGRTLLVRKMDAVAGYNSLRINRAELANGVLSYTIVAGDFTATRQMVVVR